MEQDREEAGVSERGLFLVFEGGDGVGKTTQVELLQRWLADRGREVVRTFEPGGFLNEVALSPDAAWVERRMTAQPPGPGFPRQEPSVASSKLRPRVLFVFMCEIPSGSP